MSSINAKIGPSESKGVYETYIETWDSSTMAAIDALAKNWVPPSLAGVSINIAFASFGKNPPHDELTVINLSDGELKELVDAVHQYGGEVKISFGGAARTDPAGYAMWLSDFLKSEQDAAALSKNIAAFIMQYGFDGIDFDIEDRGVSTDFPGLAAALIEAIRKEMPSTEITLTIPGQPWGQYWVELIQKSVSDVDRISFMEYDIWIDATGEGTDGTPKTYATQIQWDVKYYISQFGIPPEKLELGLMPGYDDIGNNLTLNDAVSLAKWAQSIDLAGVMTWDLNRDYAGQDGMAPVAYSNGIRKALSVKMVENRYSVQQPMRGKRGPKHHRANAPEVKDIDPDKLPKPKPGGLFDIAPPNRDP